MRIELRIAGEARGKARTRPSLGRSGAFFKPKADRVAEADIMAAWREAGGPRIPDDTAIRILLVIATVRPKGHFRKDGSLSATGLRHPVPRNKKPDIDNAIKLVMDAMNKVVYRDDVAVAQAGISRVWAEWPETLIVVETIHDPVA